MIKSNFWLLVKTNLRGAFDIRRYKKKKVALTSFITFFILMGLLYFLLSAIINFTMFMQIKEMNGNYNSAIIMACGYCAMITFSTGIFRAKGIFNGNDYEVLKSLPIKNKEIISAKIFSMYIVELVYSLIIMLPNTILALVFTGNSIYLLYGIILILFLPCFPIMLAVLIASILTLLIDGSRFASIINVLAYIVLMLVCVLFSALNSSDQINSVANLLKYVNPGLLFFEMALNDGFIYMLYFILINIAMAVFTILFISRIYDLGHKVSDVNTKPKKNVAFKQKTGFKSLTNMEYKKIFTSKLYLINSVSGAIAAIVVVVSMYFSISSAADIFEKMKNYLYMLALVPMIMLSIAVPTTSTFSHEGKHIWLLKALPIDAKKIFKSKLYVSVSISCTLSIISAILLGVLIKASWFDWLVILSLNILYVILCNLIGMAFNCKFYRFDWTEEREIFKNSASVLISTCVGFLIEIVAGCSLIGLGIINRWLGFLTTAFLFTLASYLIYTYLIKNSASILKKME